MARILRYTPAWLSRPSPGFNLFASKSPPKFDRNSTSEDGPLRTVAHRGTEIFVSVDNELRWSDLVYLKDEWQSRQQKNGNGNNDGGTNGERSSFYRVLKVPVSRRIKQLIVSPNEDYLAILTSHTVHVAILPDPSHLTSSETAPLKLRTFQVGPTSHVVERAALATALWHPLGEEGTCLVTITEDAIVRIWELDKDNRWSVDVPGLAIDLRKLANGSSSPEDVTPSKYGTSKGFSPDSFDMKVSAACFGGSGHEKEDVWASMTLWVAMREGDIYALCPLLPSKFQAASTIGSRLSAAIKIRGSSASTGKEKLKIRKQQKMWLSGIEKLKRDSDSLYSDREHHVYIRPTHPGAIPALQGPFSFTPDIDDITDLADITVMSSSGEHEIFEDIQDEEQRAVLSVSVLCLANSDGKLHFCLNMNGVEAAWPVSTPVSFKCYLIQTKVAKPTILKQSISTLVYESDFDTELLHLETLALAKAGGASWPVFTPDLQSRYSFLVTHSQGVSQVSLAWWFERLATELDNATDSGTAFRVDLLAQNVVAEPETLIKVSGNDQGLPACVRILDADLGYFILTVADQQPEVVVLDDADYSLFLESDPQEYGDEEEVQRLVTQEARPAYQRAQEFWYESAIIKFLEEQLKSHHRRTMTEEIKLSPMNLKVIMEAHRILSHETHRLGLAAAELFRRCGRLQAEFKDQIQRANDIASRVDTIVDDETYVDEENEETIGAVPKIEKRLARVDARQRELTDRHNQLRERVSRLSGRALNEKEHAWMQEIESMRRLVSTGDTDASNGGYETVQVPPWQRFSNVKTLADQLVSQSEEETAATDGADSGISFGVSMDQKRARSAHIRVMLEREGALIDATKEKLEELRLLSASASG